jgi:hypothetical protein
MRKGIWLGFGPQILDHVVWGGRVCMLQEVVKEIYRAAYLETFRGCSEGLSWWWADGNALGTEKVGRFGRYIRGCHREI